MTFFPRAIISTNQICHISTTQLIWLEKLSEGGSSIVTKAYDKTKNKFVAIKQFNKIEEDPKQMMKQMEQIRLEDDLLKRIEKIQCYDYFLKYDGVFRSPKEQDALVLRLENGCATLDDIIKAGKTYNCSEILYVFPKLIEGFFVLEENRIANRDVKPENIILVEDKNTFLYKISDLVLDVIWLRGNQ